MEISKCKCDNQPKEEQSEFITDPYIRNWRNSNGESALHEYARYIVQPPRYDEKGRLYYDFPKTALMKYAISLGCDVDAKDNLGRTPLMLAVTITEEVLTIGCLLNANADIYVTNFEGVSALRMAIVKSQVWLPTLKPTNDQLVILLLFFERIKSDFYINKMLTLQRLQSVGCPKALVPFIKCNEIRRYLFDSSVALEERLNGLTALHVAVMSQDILSVKLLVELGQDVNVVDSCQQTALFAHDPLAKYGSERFEILQTLLNHGASLYIPRSDGITPMEYLLKYGRKETIEKVLESNANFMQKCGSKGENALHFLVQNENLKLKFFPEMIILLLRKSFNLNMPDNNGMSALTYAIKHELEMKIGHLLTMGAKANWIELVEHTSMLDIFMNGYCDKGKALYYQWVVQLIFLQQGINVRYLFDELNTGFIRKLDNQFYGQIVIAQLVIAESTGQRIPDSTLEYIKSEITFRVHYDTCREKLEELKSVTVYDSLTVYQLLTETDGVINNYISNKDFLAGLKYVASDKSYQNSYYVVIARKRIENAIRIMELRKKGGRVVSECTGLNVIGINKDHYVVQRIISYLSNWDVQNLFDDQLSMKDIPSPPPRTPNVQGNIFSRAIRKFFERTDDY